MKQNFGVNARVLVLMTITAILFSLFFISLYLLERSSYNIVLKSAQEQLDKEADALISVSARSLDQITWDYTYWDEFVSAIKKGEAPWYDENITTIITSFHMDYVCVYDENFNIVHEASSENTKVRNIIPRSLLFQIKDSPQNKFYLNTSDGIFMFSEASVHSTSDPTHKTTPAGGYLFVAKTLDSAFIDDLSSLSGTNIKLLSPSDSLLSQNENNVSTVVALNGLTGTPVGRMLFNREQEGLKLYKRSSFIMLLIIFSSFIITWLVFRFALSKWVLKPLRLVTTIIGSEDIKKINELQKAPWEFNQIGHLFERHVKQKEELLKAKVKAEGSDKLKSSFLSNMSHEIRSPMNSIVGFAGLLKEPDLPVDQKLKFIKIIEDNGARMLNLISDLLIISKIEAGHLEVNISQFNLYELLDYVYAFFKPEVERKGMQLIMEKKLGDNYFNVRSDREKVYTIVSNLLKNASKYSKTGSVKFGFEVIANDLKFFVHDTGIGISKENLALIFDRFIQTDASLSRKYEGAGLGLSIAKAYVEALSGRIWVESEPDAGSSFYFTIPCEFVSFIDNSSI